MKNGIKKGKGLDLEAEPPRISILVFFVNNSSVLILLQNMTIFYYNSRQLGLLQNTTIRFYNSQYPP